MRKTILTLFMFTMALSSAFADADYTKRKNCWGPVSWRHIAYANVWKITGQPYYFADGAETKKGCDPQYVAKYGQFVPITPAPFNPQAKAIANNNVLTEWVAPGFTTKFGAGWNTSDQLGEFSFASMYQQSSNLYDDYEGTIADISTDSIEFNERRHSVMLRRLAARLGVDDPDMANPYATIKIWILDGSNAEDDKDAKVITSFQAFVLNGKLVIEGNWSENSFKQEDQKSIFNLRIANMEIKIPEELSLDSVFVKIGSDIGNLGEGVNPNYKLNTETVQYKNATQQPAGMNNVKFILNINGNPVTNDLNFELANGTTAYRTASVAVVSGNGNIFRRIPAIVPTSSKKQFRINLAGLPADRYYLQVITETGEQFTRKFIKL